MSKLPRVSGRRVVRALERVRGSHHYLRRSGEGALVVVPVHGNRDPPVGTLRAVLRQADMTPEDLRGFLQWNHESSSHPGPQWSGETTTPRPKC
ncbi:MAG TPA: type II toxin-antitoxin system HicA family toxin [Actinomycetota bacterium]|nr:type II toxin-antitoxin system HicA family toxin [Actinomycetota bacterium]